MAVKIVTDSACDLPPALIREHGIEVVPIRINLGRQSYLDGVDLNPREINAKIAQWGGVPTTSQPSPFAFQEKFAALLDQGHEVLCLTMSAALSGTYHSAVIAARQLQGAVAVADTRLVSTGLGLLVTRAAHRAAQGGDLQALKEYAEAEARRITMYAVLDSVEPIVRGGRLNVFARHAASRQGIKLLFGLNENGAVHIVERVRGRNHSLDRLAELVAAKAPREFAVAHVDCIGEAELVAGAITRQCGAPPLYVSPAGGTVSTYAGRGAIIVAC